MLRVLLRHVALAQQARRLVQGLQPVTVLVVYLRLVTVRALELLRATNTLILRVFLRQAGLGRQAAQAVQERLWGTVL